MNTDDMTREEMWDKLVAEGIATNQELELAIDLLNYSRETTLKVLRVRTGFRNFEQLEDCEDE